jgi:para-aminobenzoate synthetase component 1
MASPFSGYLACGDSTVLSFSPERFLHLIDGRVETRPIKGTARRAGTPAADRRAVQRLCASEKDRAENVMIVDLMRNDLGTVCRSGTVHVEQLCALESYANVHHLVSSVTGILAPGTSAARLLGNCFPGGSITGAPKIRAMQIIDELEPDPRSAYCGSLGYISFDGTMDTSIAIRTLVCDGRRIHAWGGGGLVADSECEAEYRECLTKIDPLLAGIGRAAD